ncbi:DUF4595 domain-containing protein [Mucilaginibacter ginsenosidivorax]|uniref:DUF4595 domain-containing protein n=2 Tax=Mucilaginibacter ginsenosidivorax TaxID=862126 RepID=A0A5B8W4E6_9SPHI|nr:DUF4595 domain-containing protein [Mucilaginibacter ginsenosidivorax]
MCVVRPYGRGYTFACSGRRNPVVAWYVSTPYFFAEQTTIYDNMKQIFKPVTLLWVLLISIVTQTKAQDLPPMAPLNREYLVSQIDGDGYTMKYQYDSKYRLTSFTIFNKYNLNDVKRFTLQYLPNKIVMTSRGTEYGDSPQTFKTDLNGHVKEITSAAWSSKEYFFDYIWKFTYSNAGYLERINMYSRGDKSLQYIYQVMYDSGNISDLKTAFNAGQPDNKGIDFAMTYYDKESVLNMNFILQMLYTQKNLYGDYLADRMFLGIPGELFGVQNNRLIASITYKNMFSPYNDSKGYHESWNKTYNIKYDFDDKGLIRSVIIDDHVYKITFKTGKG